MHGGSNVAVHCFLLQLERRIATHGRLPDTIFYQVDGGSENANVVTLAICELLVAKRLTKRIYLTRLPVGHTHEDIDAKFGHLWYFVRLRMVFTMQVSRNLCTQLFLLMCRLTDYDSFQMYEAILYRAFEKGKLAFSVKNLFVVPDYIDVLRGHTDTKLSK